MFRCKIAFNRSCRQFLEFRDCCVCGATHLSRSMISLEISWCLRMMHVEVCTVQQMLMWFLQRRILRTYLSVPIDL